MKVVYAFSSRSKLGLTDDGFGMCPGEPGSKHMLTTYYDLALVASWIELNYSKSKQCFARSASSDLKS
eukprot:5644459-Amphidinium_carterae.1